MSKREEAKGDIEEGWGGRQPGGGSPTICQGPKESVEAMSPVMPPAERAVVARAVFGPFYSHVPVLQAAVNHAERAHRVVTTLMEEQDAARRTHWAHELSHAEQWLSGRDSELLVWVGEHIYDWREARFTAAEAAEGIERYLKERIHEGLRLEFGRDPSCCLDLATAPTLTYFTAPSAASPPAVVAHASPVSDADELLPANVPPPPSTPVSPIF